MRICQSKELKDFTTELSNRFRLCCYNGIGRFAPIGEKYITFSPNATTKKAVIEEFKRAMHEYCGILPSHYTIYWRKYPELTKWPERFTIYSRLLISRVNPRTDLVSGRSTMQNYLEKGMVNQPHEQKH